MATVYRAPGVYIQDVQNPAFGALPAGFRVPGLVATGKSTLPVKNTPITKGSANGTDTIPTSGLTVVAVTVVGDTPDTSQYKSGIDYNSVNNTIVWINGGQQPTTGATYYVSWTRAKVAAEFLPMQFTNLKDVRDAYGNELESGVYNAIPTAANLLFQNGAPAVIIAQAVTAAVTDLQNAIDNMKVQDIDVLVVPQATNSALWQYVRGHVLTQSSPSVRHERVFLTGPDGFSDAITTIAAKATSIAHERMWLLAPPSIVVTLRDAITLTDQDVFLPAQYMAAALAGAVTNPSEDAATPITRRSIVGIKNLSTFNYQQSDKDYLGAAGVMVINDTPNIQVRHAITTDTTNVNTVTASVVLIKDNVKKTLRPLLDKAYIGTKITSRTPSEVATTITTFLEQKITDQIIVAYRNISVVQDAIDPRTINIKFDIKPVYPLEFIDVSFSLVTQ